MIKVNEAIKLIIEFTKEGYSSLIIALCLSKYFEELVEEIFVREIRKQFFIYDYRQQSFTEKATKKIYPQNPLLTEVSLLKKLGVKGGY